MRTMSLPGRRWAERRDKLLQGRNSTEHCIPRLTAA